MLKSAAATCVAQINLGFTSANSAMIGKWSEPPESSSVQAVKAVKWPLWKMWSMRMRGGKAKSLLGQNGMLYEFAGKVKPKPHPASL